MPRSARRTRASHREAERRQADYGACACFRETRRAQVMGCRPHGPGPRR
jgi:hypothetical protein